MSNGDCSILPKAMQGRAACLGLCLDFALSQRNDLIHLSVKEPILRYAAADRRWVEALDLTEERFWDALQR